MCHFLARGWGQIPQAFFQEFRNSAIVTRSCMHCGYWMHKVIVTSWIREPICFYCCIHVHINIIPFKEFETHTTRTMRFNYCDSYNPNAQYYVFIMWRKMTCKSLHSLKRWMYKPHYIFRPRFVFIGRDSVAVTLPIQFWFNSHCWVVSLAVNQPWVIWVNKSHECTREWKHSSITEPSAYSIAYSTTQ